MSEWDDAAAVRWWCPFDEAGWYLEPCRFGAAPREARLFQPPLTKSARRGPWIGGALLVAELGWLLWNATHARLSILPPLAVLAVTALATAAILGRVIFGKRPPAWYLEQELALAQDGEVAVLTVERVHYERKKTRAGYRDGVAIDLAAGNAEGSYHTADGRKHAGMVTFGPGQPALRDGDRVTVIHGDDQLMAVRIMGDVEFPEIRDAGDP